MASCPIGGQISTAVSAWAAPGGRPVEHPVEPVEEEDLGRGPAGPRGRACLVSAPGASPRRRSQIAAITSSELAQDVHALDPDLQLALDPDDHLHREQRVGPELEEVVVEPDGRDAEHLLPDRREALLGRRLGRAGARAAARRARRGSGIGQRVAIELEVVVERQARELDVHRPGTM